MEHTNYVLRAVGPETAAELVLMTNTENLGAFPADLARFITRACNSHDELLEALKLLATSVKMAHVKGPETPGWGSVVGAVNIANGVIAKATKA